MLIRHKSLLRVQQRNKLLSFWLKPINKIFCVKNNFLGFISTNQFTCKKCQNIYCFHLSLITHAQVKCQKIFRHNRCYARVWYFLDCLHCFIVFLFIRIFHPMFFFVVVIFWFGLILFSVQISFRSKLLPLIILVETTATNWLILKRKEKQHIVWA